MLLVSAGRVTRTAIVAGRVLRRIPGRLGGSCRVDAGPLHVLEGLAGDPTPDRHNADQE